MPLSKRVWIVVATSLPALLAAAASPLHPYSVDLTEHSTRPVLSSANAKGHGHSDCLIFNPSYIPASSTFNQSGLLVRQCCGSTCAGHGLDDSMAPSAHQERIGFAPCSLKTGICEDVVASDKFNLDPLADAEDPRALYYDGYYWLFYYRSPSKSKMCVGPQCTVQLSRTQTPLIASSWQRVGTYPWHRNGCCILKPKGQPSFCIWGEGPSPLPGLGISSTMDISSGVFTQTEWKFGGSMDNTSTPLSADQQWFIPLGAAQQEIKLEAGAHPVELSTGDHLFFYAAATPGWVANGNYTVGYVVLAKDDPTKILQREPQFMVPTYDYETLCDGRPDCAYKGERKNVIFMCSATPTTETDEFRLFFGAGDGNVGTAIVKVNINAIGSDTLIETSISV